MVGVMWAVASAAAQEPRSLHVIQAEYETRIRRGAGEPVELLETGTHYIALDGRYRVDRLMQDGEQRSEVRGVDISGAVNRIGRSGRSRESLQGVVPVDILERIERDAQLSREAPSNNLALAPDQEHLGTRQVGELVLEGIRTVAVNMPLMPDGTRPTAETWIYFPQPAGDSAPPLAAPVIMESSFTMGRGGFVETRLVQANSAYVTADWFDVPIEVPDPIIRER